MITFRKAVVIIMFVCAMTARLVTDDFESFVVFMLLALFYEAMVIEEYMKKKFS